MSPNCHARHGIPDSFRLTVLSPPPIMAPPGRETTMRPKKIVLFTLGLLTVFAALLGLKKLRE